MSDFSQLCPLFNTGVYSELTIPGPIAMSGVSATSNALVGALTRAAYPGSFKFQRTVVVTRVYIKKDKTCGTACIIAARRHAATGTAAGTKFASFAVTTTVTKNTLSRIKAMTTASKREFEARRLAPCKPVHATSPQAKSPGMVVRPSRSVLTPPQK